MATIQEELDLAFVEVGTQIKATKTLIGILANLTTTEKTNLVLAINEVNAKTANAGAQINDTTPSTTTAYSSSKTNSSIEARAVSLKADILGGAGTTIDTLKEIADLLVASDLNDDNAIAALTTSVGTKLSFDIAQTLTVLQKAQANANAGALSLVTFGNTATSYKTTFLTAVA